MSRDDLNEIPSFTANRDEAVSSAPRGAIPPRAARAEAGLGLTARLVLTIALALAGTACAWAWQLQTLADASRTQQLALQGRVADLEALLSDTDDTVNKSAAAMSAASEEPPGTRARPAACAHARDMQHTRRLYGRPYDDPAAKHVPRVFKQYRDSPSAALLAGMRVANMVEGLLPPTVALAAGRPRRARTRTRKRVRSTCPRAWTSLGAAGSAQPSRAALRI